MVPLDVKQLIIKLLDFDLFDGFSSDSIEEFINKRGDKSIINYQPHHVLWRGIQNHHLDFMIIIEGACIVMDSRNETADALLTKGQLIGEFELLGFPSSNQNIETLCESIIFKPSTEALDILISNNSELFYKNLARTLVQKLRIENQWIKIRDNQAVGFRLASLLIQFADNNEWESLVTYLDINEKEGYSINIYWSFSQLNSALSADSRSSNTNLYTFIKEGIIEVTGYKVCKESGRIFSLDDFKLIPNTKNKVVVDIRQDEYIKISVIDKNKAIRYFNGNIKFSS